MRYSAIFLSILLLFCAQAFSAQIRLETVGKTYPVTEESLINAFKKRASAIDILALRDAQASYQPANLQALPRARSDRAFTVEPSHSLDEDIRDSQGNLLYPQGFSFNPLHYARLRGSIVVIDASDPEQLAWFKSSYGQNQQDILLLSGGLAGHLTEELGRPVYYLSQDMAARLRLEAVPAVITADKDSLSVRELRLAPLP